MDSDNINRINNWLIAEMGYYHSYHNHKETMAWVATALYVPGIIILAYQLAYGTQNIPPFWLRLLVFSLIFVAFAVVFCFVNMQLNRRNLANYTVFGLRRTLMQLYCGKIQEKPSCEIEKSKEWPSFIKEQIECAKKSPKIGRYAKRSEVITYIAIGLATLIALVILGSSLCN